VNKLISIAGDVAAVVGILLCALTGAARLLGTYQLLGIGTNMLFMAGIGIMVFACLAKLHLLTAQHRGG
jgi:hypothetical protein